MHINHVIIYYERYRATSSSMTKNQSSYLIGFHDLIANHTQSDYSDIHFAHFYTKQITLKTYSLKHMRNFKPVCHPRFEASQKVVSGLKVDKPIIKEASQKVVSGLKLD
jgi:hypothetical protein